jgi:hypothetical protein
MPIGSSVTATPQGSAPFDVRISTPDRGAPVVQQPYPAHPNDSSSPRFAPPTDGSSPATYPSANPNMYPPGGITEVNPATQGSSMRWIWWVIGLLVLGAGAGAVLALVMQN